MKRSTIRTIAVLGAAVPVVLALGTPAGAGPKDGPPVRSTGGQANVDWTEYDLDDRLGLPGNTHVGFLGVYQQVGWTDVYGAIQDFDCDEGEVPGFGHGEEPTEGKCDLIGVRWLSGGKDGTDVTFTVNPRSGTATLTGRLTVGNGGHGEGDGTVLGRPEVDITWTASGGNKYRFQRSERWSDGTFSYRSMVRGSGAEAVVSGRIGAMGFTDDADDTSYASTEQWIERSRFRMR